MSHLATAVSLAASFGVANAPMADGSDVMSPTTVATLAAPVQLVVAYPAGVIDVTAADGLFTFDVGGTKWSDPAHTTATLTDSEGNSGPYDVFTFTWLGDRSQETVDATTGIFDWVDAPLAGRWAVPSDYCIAASPIVYYSNYYAGGFDLAALDAHGTFTTANCAGGELTSIAGWQPFAGPIRG